MYFATADGSVSACARQYSDKGALLTDMASRVKQWRRPVVFMAGHFMLMYSRHRTALIPMIDADVGDPRERDFIRSRVGSFPLQSLSLAADVIAICGDSETRIALLVNDHQFKRFQPEVDRQDALPLVRRFYRQNLEIPDSFTRLLTDRGLDPQTVIVRNDRPPRNGRGLLPRRTPFFSETNLRNCFGARMMSRLALNPRFRLERIDGFPHLYHTAARAHASCLTDSDSGCGCSGEVLQFIGELSNARETGPEGSSKPTGTIVLIAPDECEAAVRAGLVAGMDAFSTLVNGAVVSGLDADGPLVATYYAASGQEVLS